MPHYPSRFPYGISFVKPGAKSEEYTLVAGDQTPDVSMGTYFITASSALTITNFDGGERGKIIFLRCSSGSVTTIQNSAGGINITNIVMGVTGGANLFLSSSNGNALLLNEEVAPFAHNGTDWDYVGVRAVINTQV